VIRPTYSSIDCRESDDGWARVRAGAGVVLDDLVSHMVHRGVWGLENLSHIPGLVGAVPIQNVGAYGVEAGEHIETVTVFDPDTLTTFDLTQGACAFGYRTSHFKTEEGKRLIITHVTFRLSHEPRPQIHYKDFREYFKEGDTPTQNAIRDAVIAIRMRKFPDWHRVGTAGSFFKNPIISATEYSDLLRRYPKLPGFLQKDGRVKVSLGWILDHVLSLKGYQKGNVGLSHAQALVLVRYGDATAEEIISFSDEVIKKVFEVTRIIVEREVVTLESW
jgi:UDP-N-acetylmuramate dehydrogenase